MSISYDQKTWYNGEEGGTPITASELNRMEQGIADAVEAINEGGGGQGGGAHTNLDNIANTTTNNVKGIGVQSGYSSGLATVSGVEYPFNEVVFDFVGNAQTPQYAKITDGKTYLSSDGVTWNAYDNDIDFGNNNTFLDSRVAIGNGTYFAIFSMSNSSDHTTRVQLWASTDLLHWWKLNSVANTDSDHATKGYEVETSTNWSDDLCKPMYYGTSGDSKIYFYLPFIYNSDTTTYPIAYCISCETSSKNMRIESITEDVKSIGAFNDKLRSTTNIGYTSFVFRDDDSGDEPVPYIWTTTNGTTFTRAECTTDVTSYLEDRPVYYNDGKYYMTADYGDTYLLVSTDLTNWTSQSWNFQGSYATPKLIGFRENLMIVKGNRSSQNENVVIYLKADSNGHYPTEYTLAQIAEIDGCGITDVSSNVDKNVLETAETTCSSGLDNNLIDTTNQSQSLNYNRLFLATPFVNEVSLAANILGLGSGSSGGGSGTSDYPDLTNKPSINGVELLGNKLVGLLSTDIQINAEKIGYSGTVSGANTAKAAIESLKSSIDNISVDADDVAYDNTTSGLTATNVQDAIDEVNSAKGNASISVLPNTYNGVFRITNESTSSNHDVYAKSYVKDMLDPCLQTPINNLQPNIVAVSTLVTLKTDSSADYGQIVQLQCQSGTYNGAFDNSGNATFNVGYVGVYKIYIASTYRRSIYINSTGGCFHFPLSSTMTNVDIRTRDAKIIGQQLGIFDTSDNMIAKFKLTKDDYSIALPNPSSTYIVKMYVDVDQSISQATTNVSDQFVPNTADVVLCTHPASGNYFDPIVRISTTDLTPGSSDLDDGTIYLVYE